MLGKSSFLGHCRSGVRDRTRLPGGRVLGESGEETPGEGVALDEQEDDRRDDQLDDAERDGERCGRVRQRTENSTGTLPYPNPNPFPNPNPNPYSNPNPIHN